MTQPPFGGPSGSPGAPASRHDKPDPGGTTAPGSATSDAIPAPPSGYPAYRAPAPKRRRGVLIASLALAAAVVLCGGGGTLAFLALRDSEGGSGAKEPTVAVDGFLTAVYQDRDAGKAANFVCSESRDQQKISAKVAEVQKYATTYTNPRFRWSSPTVDSQNGDRATVSTKLTMTTGDERIAEQPLRFTVVRKAGWWVCEVG
ncbi:Rv0361 family membrane protein [Micromonospora sp. NBC_00421]|uniref:Rv0361 family membrane protein n=1 Tax=Micromonospora sp. NBC_00421 TaxID=2975976 RepID=UPI002E1D601D